MQDGRQIDLGKHFSYIDLYSAAHLRNGDVIGATFKWILRAFTHLIERGIYPRYQRAERNNKPHHRSLEYAGNMIIKTIKFSQQCKRKQYGKKLYQQSIHGGVLTRDRESS